MISCQNWRQIKKLPKHSGDGWAIWKNNHVTHSDVSEIEAGMGKRYPANLVLVGKPGGRRFVPQICIAIFQKKIFGIMRRSYTNLMLVFVIMAMLHFSLAIVGDSADQLKYCLLMLLMASIFAFEYFGVFRSKNGIFERVMFFYWLRNAKQPRIGLVIWIIAGIAMGCSQLLLQEKLGGMEALFHAYGTMYEQVRDGEFWRLIVGPFIHYSEIHFVINFSMLLFIGTFTWALLGPISMIVFLAGNTIGAFSQLTWGGELYDNFGGVSGGVYALFGFLIICSVMNRRLLPKGLGLFCANMTIIGILSAELTSVNSATVAHIAGVSAGVFFGAIYSWRKPNLTDY